MTRLISTAAAIAAILATAGLAAAADPSCQLTFRVGTSQELSGLTAAPSYGNAPGEFEGEGELVECQPLNDSLVDVEDDEALRVLSISMLAEPIEGPIDILQCTWLPVARFPIAADFDLSNQTGFVGVVPPILFVSPDLHISDIECTGTIESTTTTTTILTTTTTIITTTTTTSTTTTSTIATTTTTTPAPEVCGDYDASGEVTIADALGVLRTSVGLVDCDLCICDVDSSGSNSIGDALRILRRVVGQPVTLECADC